MLTLSDVLRFVVTPLVVSAILIAVTGRFSWGPALAAGAAFIAAFAAIAGPAKVWRIPDATGWLVYAGGVFTAIALFATVVAQRGWLVPIVQLIATAAVAGLMLRFNFSNRTWSPLGGGIVLLIISLLALINTASMRWRAKQRTIVTPLAMSMIAGLGGLAVMTLADQSVGEGIAALGVAFLPVVAGSFLSRQTSASESAIVFGGVLVTCLACSAYASEVPLIDAAIIAAAAPLFALSGLLPKWKLRDWQLATIRLVITAVPLLIVLGLAVRAMQKANESGNESGGDQYSAVQPAVHPAIHVAAEISATS